MDIKEDKNTEKSKKELLKLDSSAGLSYTDFSYIGLLPDHEKEIRVEIDSDNEIDKAIKLLDMVRRETLLEENDSPLILR